MDDCRFKRFVYQKIAGVPTALGAPHRLELLHLLRRARLVEHVKVGRRVYYSATPMAISLWNAAARAAAAIVGAWRSLTQ
ncbi:MAG: hypothetical protein EA404_09810 [Spirochaetaceae bacterium]|nr:MAG: hypothetical protein EA404_09810 [Spirochaetaceae bacterium]